MNILLSFECLILLTSDWSIWVNDEDFIVGQTIEVIDEDV